MNKIFGYSSSRKVAVIGSGFVGSSIVYSLMIKGLASEMVLIDTNTKKCLAEVNDIRHGIPYMGSSNIYAGDYCDIADCDLIIITAGRNRLPNETRLDMAKDNINIIKNVTDEIKKYYNRGIILIVTNPVDIITRKITEWLNIPEGMVFGTGCILDSSRLTNVIADYVGLNSDVVSAHIIGEHGDGQIALWSNVTIAGASISEYCDMTGLAFTDSDKRNMEDMVKSMGSDIIGGKGRTHYGITTCVCYIADAILNRRATIASVSSILRGEYGINDVALSILSVIGANGIERRLTDRLTDVEFSMLKSTADLLNNIGL